MEVVPEVQVPPTVEEENVVVALLQTDWVPDKVPATGAAVMITVAVVVTAEQPPVAASVYVTVWVPGLLELGIDKLGRMRPATGGRRAGRGWRRAVPRPGAGRPADLLRAASFRPMDGFRRLCGTRPPL